MTSFEIDVSFSIFRVARLLRVFKLAKMWKSFDRLLVTMMNALKNIGVFSLLLLLFILMFTVLGLELFSNKILLDNENKPVSFNTSISYQD